MPRGLSTPSGLLTTSLRSAATLAWEATTAATPRAWPNCREVVAIAEAAPACSPGIPGTAAFVMGALTNPKPHTRYGRSAMRTILNRGRETA